MREFLKRVRLTLLGKPLPEALQPQTTPPASQIAGIEALLRDQQRARLQRFEAHVAAELVRMRIPAEEAQERTVLLFGAPGVEDPDTLPVVLLREQAIALRLTHFAGGVGIA